MKKNILFILLVVLAFSGALLAKGETILKVRVKSANVRSEPHLTAPVVAKVAAGTLLEAFDQEGAWYKVTVKNQAGNDVGGYINKNVVDVINEKEEEATVAEKKEKRHDAAVRHRVSRPLPAKEFAAGGFKLLGGLSLSNLNMSDPLSEDSKKVAKTGLMGGLGYESGGRLAFEADLLFNPIGAVFKDAVDASNKERITLSGTAITMPLLLKLRFLPGTTPYLLAGGEIGYILSQKVAIKNAEGVVISEKDIIDEVNRLLYGLVLGGGVELPAGKMDLLLEVRYRLGLSNMVKEAEAGEYTRATALSFLLGLRF